MAKVIYILAAGHSGSTLLDLALGQHAEVSSTGELTFLPWQFLRNGKMCPKGEDRCTCGSCFTECAYWRRVLSACRPETKHALEQDPASFRMSFSGSIGHRVSRSGRLGGFLSRLLVRFTGWNTYGHLDQSKTGAIAANNWELIDAIAAASGTQYVVDSSKDPFRAYHLWCCRPKDFIPVVLIRDVAGQIASKHLQHNGVRKNVRRWLNFYSHLVHPLIQHMGVAPKLIRYEAFCAAPEATLNEEFQSLKLNYDGLLEVIRPGQSHLVAGNPMRYKESFNIRKPGLAAKRLGAESMALVEAARKANPYGCGRSVASANY